MQVRPLRDRILVKRIEEGKQRAGGIIIPDTARKNPSRRKLSRWSARVSRGLTG